MKLGTIISRVQRKFGDEVGAQITEEDIVGWVNDACLEIVTQNRTNQGVKVGTTSVVAGKSNYDLPSDLYLLRNVKIKGRVLTQSTYEQISSSYGFEDSEGNAKQGTPFTYCVYQRQLTLYPQPSEPEGNVDILYIKYPDLSDINMKDREPDVPIQFHPRILDYCIAQASELDDNLEHYRLKMNEFRVNIGLQNYNGQQPGSDSTYASITYIDDGV